MCVFYAFVCVSSARFWSLLQPYPIPWVTEFRARSVHSAPITARWVFSEHLLGLGMETSKGQFCYDLEYRGHLGDLGMLAVFRLFSVVLVYLLSESEILESCCLSHAEGPLGRRRSCRTGVPMRRRPREVPGRTSFSEVGTTTWRASSGSSLTLEWMICGDNSGIL